MKQGKNTRTLNTGHIVIDSQGETFNTSVTIKAGGTYAADDLVGGELVQINTDVEKIGDAAWAAQTKLKWGVVLGNADESGRLLIVTENAGLCKKALIGLTDEIEAELIGQGFKLLEQA